jgi:ABC-type multidrug transport system ATPase subunit
MPKLQVALRWEDIKYSVTLKEGKQRKEILKGLSGNVEPGKLCAILGPSGSGKVKI